MSKQLLTHSRMQSFKKCRKRHWFEYELGLRKDVDAKALRMGGAIHDGLDLLRKGNTLEEALEAVRERYQFCPDPIDDYDWAIEQETVECLIAGYDWRWKGATLDIVASEESFRIPLVNPKTGAASKLWELAGKQDGIVAMDGRKLVLETKTTSDSLEQDGDYYRRLQLDSQISIYTIAARDQKHDVSGVLYDVVRKPTIKPTPVAILDDDGLKIVVDSDGERVKARGDKWRQTADKAKGYVLQTRPMAPAEWGQKLLKDIGDRPEYYYARIEIARTDDELDEMRSELWDIQQTIRGAQNDGTWFRTVDRDTCTFCSYFGLCASKYKPVEDVAPDGFVLTEHLHPELN